MPPEFLDPEDKDVCGAIRGTGVLLPAKVRKFGRVPEFEKIEPGDVVLTEPIKRGVISTIIQAAQKTAGFDYAHARWTHAAVAVDDRFVIEANVPGVVLSDLLDRATSFRIRVRRPYHLSQIQRYRLALQASNTLRRRYSLFTALAVGRASLVGLMNHSTLLNYGRGTICSKLYSDCYLRVSGNRALTDNPYVVTPAHLSMSAELQDVRIGWLALE